MPQSKPLVVLEFNELTPKLMDRFIARGLLPNFAALRHRSKVFVTDAGEVPPNLEPWIQWVTVHTGRPYRDHKVYLLGDSARFKGNSIWDIAGKHQKTAWVCGSMNASFGGDFRGTFLPDPWSVSVRPNVTNLLPYFDFVRSQVMEYTRTKTAFPLATTAQFVWFMLRNGLRFSTIVAIAKQLASESGGNNRWKRANILDRLQFDLFRSHFKKNKPDISTFFLNSTAHYQHVYWRNMDPQEFTIKPTDEEQKYLESAVLHGYQSMDRIVGEVMDLVGSNGTIVLASALGQQPCLAYESSGGKCFYKPNKFSTLLSFAGIDPSHCKAEPVMSEEFHVRFASEAIAIEAAKLLRNLVVDNSKALNVLQNGDSLMVGCCIYKELPPDATIEKVNGKTSFSDLFYFVDTKKSGMHHPDGIFWVAAQPNEGSLNDVPQRINLIDVAPTLLKVLGVPVPNDMPGRPAV